MTDMTGTPLICIRCLRAPVEIHEYRVAADREDMTPDAFVRSNEGTLNESNGHFACTECYIAMGMPTAPGRGWKAP